MENPVSETELRDIAVEDLAIFFEHQRDPKANFMAAFTAENPSDHDAFMKHWRKILADETTINKTIVLHGEVVGHIAKFVQFGEPEVTYWIGREFWGKGIATAALREFLALIELRPLYARAVKDNIGSIRVLEKCGFVITGEDKGFANGRNAEVEEYILTLA